MLRLFAALILGAGLLRAAAAETKPETPTRKEPARRLVRLDLFRKPPAADIRVLRNIFLIGPPAAETFPEVAGPSPGKRLLPDAAKDAAGRPSTAAPDIRYIGWVATPRKSVGLIYTGSDVLAVSEGDTIGGGFLVRSIGPEALEVETPEGEILRVSIEGERR